MRKVGLVLFFALNALLVVAAAHESSQWDAKQTPYEGKCDASEQC